MAFNIIDTDNWPRREYFEHYLKTVPCTYSMTVDIDITYLYQTVKSERLKLYPSLIYCLARIVNQHEAFRTALDEHKNVGVYDVIHPSYTVFHQQNQSFSSLWTAYCADFKTFYLSYQEDLREYGEIQKMIAKPPADNVFNISGIPWTTFTGFQLNLAKGYEYLLPIFTMGKFYTAGSRTKLPLSVQVHHAVCDGYHVSAFISDLQRLADGFDSVLA